MCVCQASSVLIIMGFIFCVRSQAQNFIFFLFLFHDKMTTSHKHEAYRFVASQPSGAMCTKCSTVWLEIFEE